MVKGQVELCLVVATDTAVAGVPGARLAEITT